jgi:hypothetical protein
MIFDWAQHQHKNSVIALKLAALDADGISTLGTAWRFWERRRFPDNANSGLVQCS